MTFSGRPAPKVEWTKDKAGTLLKVSSQIPSVHSEQVEFGFQSDRIQIEEVENTSTLIIHRATKEDRGKYVVRAANKLGQDKGSVEVSITDRPDPPSKPTISDVNLDSVRLRWSPPVNDGGSAVRVYTVESTVAQSDVWTKAETSKHPTITLFHLSPDQAYQFRVRAENVFGSSEPSQPSEPCDIREITRPFSEPPDKASSASPPRSDRAKSKTPASPSPAPAVDYDAAVSGPAPAAPIDPNRLPANIYDKYDVFEEVGHGAYGVVRRAVEKATGKTWAAKFVSVRPGVKREAVRHEIEIMNALSHDKLLQLHEAFDTGKEMVPSSSLFPTYRSDSEGVLCEGSHRGVCEWRRAVRAGHRRECGADGGRSARLHAPAPPRHPAHAPEEHRPFGLLLSQFTAGNVSTRTMHSADLKPENVLLQSRDSTDIKIIDFGLARRLDPGKSVKLL